MLEEKFIRETGESISKVEEKECKTMKSFKGDIPFQRLINLATHKFRLCRAENKYRIPFDISGNNQGLVFDKG